MIKAKGCTAPLGWRTSVASTPQCWLRDLELVPFLDKPSCWKESKRGLCWAPYCRQQETPALSEPGKIHILVQEKDCCSAKYVTGWTKEWAVHRSHHWGWARGAASEKSYGGDSISKLLTATEVKSGEAARPVQARDWLSRNLVEGSERK